MKLYLGVLSTLIVVALIAVVYVWAKLQTIQSLTGDSIIIEAPVTVVPSDDENRSRTD